MLQRACGGIRSEIAALAGKDKENPGALQENVSDLGAERG